jgi:menaquinol-cytochrome c reductase iron-sulfur subunit
MGFLSNVLGGVIGFVLTIPIVGYVLSPLFEKGEGRKLVELGDLNNLTEGEIRQVDYIVKRVDGWFVDKTTKTVYVKRSGNDFTVFSNICTHLGCGVKWDEQRKNFLCPCHGAVFDADGKVVAGPPPAPMTRLAHKVQNGKVYVEEA